MENKKQPHQEQVTWIDNADLLSSLFEDRITEANENLKELTGNLTKLIQEDDFYLILTFILTFSQFYTDVEDIVSRHPTENYSDEELAFICWLILKYGCKIDGKIPSSESFKKKCNEVWSIFQNIHQNILAKSPFQEVIFYSESWAYYFQYINFFISRYRNDDAWIIENKGFSLESARKIILAIQEKRIEYFSNIPDWGFEERLLYMFESFFIRIDDLKIPDISKEEVHNFLNTFSVTPTEWNQDFENISDKNEFYSRPIIKFDGNHYFLPMISFLGKAMYQEPIFWMWSDPKYSELAKKHRWDGSEEMTYEILKDVFGIEKTFKNINVMVGKRRETDADVLCFVGDKAIIVQVKSKTLTVTSRQWDEKSIESDYDKAIQGALIQGHKVRDALLQEGFSFENADWSKFIPPCKIDEAFVLCVTSDNFPSSMMIWKLLAIDPVESDVIPMVTSIFDLQVIAYYLRDPFEFLFYMKQRFLFSKHIISQSELAILWTHLRQGLHLEKDQWLYIDESMWNVISPHFLQAHGQLPESEKVDHPRNPWKNSHFEKLVELLKTSGERWFTDAILLLYSLSSEASDQIFELIEDIKKNLRENPQKPFRSAFLSFKEDDAMIWVFCSRDVSILGEEMKNMLEIRKYWQKCTKVLGIGLALDATDQIYSLFFNKTPWKFDRELHKAFEMYTQKMKTTILFGKNQKKEKIWRNDPCPCWSKNKYKKCCGK